MDAWIWGLGIAGLILGGFSLWWLGREMGIDSTLAKIDKVKDQKILEAHERENEATRIAADARERLRALRAGQISNTPKAKVP